MFSGLFATQRRRATAIGALVAVFALLIGFGAGWLTPSLRAPGDNSPEAGFARDMSTHHAQAVTMAMTVYPRATDTEVRQLAYDIALTQQSQIGIMQTWLKDWHLQPTGTRPKMAWMPNGARELTPDGLMPGMATDAQLQELDAAKGKQVDILFCQLMLRHHLGGIHMIDELLQLSHDQDVRDLAQGMKNNQQGEVVQFQTILSRLGAQPLSS
ncbi:DUF305 domain-containing protein [Rugosimonospora africana]|uniref:DUF305 domain-containing protein n=1 Tax=Rugosimonospora africana TaxID=556532 RepID=A0A8J3QKN4_9ACTN|nr:DUF305 domain-containing protein [Rugosimonospora africana]GIH11837.1 DUF305 domain-containing protein [Rugosimonospora africana]